MVRPGLKKSFLFVFKKKSLFVLAFFPPFSLFLSLSHLYLPSNGCRIESKVDAECTAQVFWNGKAVSQFYRPDLMGTEVNGLNLVLKRNWWIISQGCLIPRRADNAWAALWALRQSASERSSSEHWEAEGQTPGCLSCLMSVPPPCRLCYGVHKACEYWGEPGLSGVPLYNFLHYLPGALGESCCNFSFTGSTFSVPRGQFVTRECEGSVFVTV